MSCEISDVLGEKELCALGVDELGRYYRSGVLSPVTVAEAVLRRIDRLNAQISAFISVLSGQAIAEARAAELLFRQGFDRGPLQGIPYSVKDCIRAQGSRTTAASRLLVDALDDVKDSAVVARLRAAGAVLVGKTNLYEFAFAEPGPGDLFAEVANPRRSSHRAGGSSNGSAAAVAAGMGVISLGTDTGGSVRHPANLCGVAGFVATSGIVSQDGVIPVSYQLDRVGVLARSVADIAHGTIAIAGESLGPQEAVSLDGLRIGLPENAVFSIGASDALACFEAIGPLFAGMGLLCRPVYVPFADEANGLADLIMVVDAVVYHEKYRDRADLYGRKFVDRTRPGREVPAADYARAIIAREEMRAAWGQLFERIDVLLLPGNMAGAPRRSQDNVEVNGRPYPSRFVTSPATRASSLVGYPSLAVPVAESDEGLPIGVQLVGRPRSERTLFTIGIALERATGNLTARWGIEPVL